MMKIIVLIGVMLLIACDPGPLPDVPSRAERADYKKDWFPTSSEEPLPLDAAIQRGDLSEVRRLLAAGANPNARWSQSGDRFPLQEVLEARSFGYQVDDPVEIIRVLLGHGADPNLKWCPFESRGPSAWPPNCASAKGMTPLMSAAFSGPPEAVRLLLEAGADASVINWMGDSALDYAVDEVAFEMISRSVFADLATRNQNALAWLNRKKPDRDDGWTALAKAIGLASGPPPLRETTVTRYLLQGEGRAINRVRTVLRIGADPNERINGDWTPLSIALWDRALRVARVLLQNGADVNQRWCRRFLPTWAVNGTVPTQLKVGKDPACTFANGITPLMWSAATGDRQPVQLLLEFGADRSLKDWAGRSALHYATTREVYDLLITAGPQPSH